MRYCRRDATTREGLGNRSLSNVLLLLLLYLDKRMPKKPGTAKENLALPTNLATPTGLALPKQLALPALGMAARACQKNGTAETENINTAKPCEFRAQITITKLMAGSKKTINANKNLHTQ